MLISIAFPQNPTDKTRCPVRILKIVSVHNSLYIHCKSNGRQDCISVDACMPGWRFQDSNCIFEIKFQNALEVGSSKHRPLRPQQQNWNTSPLPLLFALTDHAWLISCSGALPRISQFAGLLLTGFLLELAPAVRLHEHVHERVDKLVVIVPPSSAERTAQWKIHIHFHWMEITHLKHLYRVKLSELTNILVRRFLRIVWLTWLPSVSLTVKWLLLQRQLGAIKPRTFKRKVLSC